MIQLILLDRSLNLFLNKFIWRYKCCTYFFINLVKLMVRKTKKPIIIWGRSDMSFSHPYITSNTKLAGGEFCRQALFSAVYALWRPNGRITYSYATNLYQPGIHIFFATTPFGCRTKLDSSNGSIMLFHRRKAKHTCCTTGATCIV
jgi:hypothetical protein